MVRIVLKHPIIGYVLAALALATFMGYATRIHDQILLARASVTAVGTVIETRCQQHLNFAYRFDANGSIHQGTSSSERCTHMKAGDDVTVRYLPDTPSLSTAADPRNALANNLETILLASLTAPAFLLVALWLRSKNDQIPHPKSD